MVHIIRQRVLNPSTKNNDALSKLLKALDKDCVSLADAFDDYKFTIFYHGRSSTFYARQFHDAKIPGIFTERRFAAASSNVKLSDPQELDIKEMLITDNDNYKQIVHKIENACLSLMEKDLSESGRYNDMMEIGGIPRTEALRYCMFEQFYPEIEFFKMSVSHLKIAVLMISEKELSLNIYNKSSLEAAVVLIKKKMRSTPTETEILYTKFGKRLTDYLLIQRKRKELKFYQLPYETLEKFIYCEDKEYERYKFIFSKTEIAEFDRLIDSSDDPHIVIVVFKDEDDNERAVIVDTKKKKKVPFRFTI